MLSAQTHRPDSSCAPREDLLMKQFHHLHVFLRAWHPRNSCFKTARSTTATTHWLRLCSVYKAVLLAARVTAACKARTTGDTAVTAAVYNCAGTRAQLTATVHDSRISHDKGFTPTTALQVAACASCVWHICLMPHRHHAMAASFRCVCNSRTRMQTAPYQPDHAAISICFDAQVTHLHAVVQQLGPNPPACGQH